MFQESFGYLRTNFALLCGITGCPLVSIVVENFTYPVSVIGVADQSIVKMSFMLSCFIKIVISLFANSAF